MGEAKRRKEMGLPPKKNKKIREKNFSKNSLNTILTKYPLMPYILGISLLIVLIIDLINFYN